MFKWIHNITAPTDLAIIPHKSIPITLAGNNKVGFNDMMHFCKSHKSDDVENNRTIIINTLPLTEQNHLIPNTLSYQSEEGIINSIMGDYRRDLTNYTVIIYGKHCADDTVDKKYKQMIRLGFSNTFIYYGGLFEWMLLQDIYGTENFPTTNLSITDPLKYSPRRKL